MTAQRAIVVRCADTGEALGTGAGTWSVLCVSCQGYCSYCPGGDVQWLVSYTGRGADLKVVSETMGVSVHPKEYGDTPPPLPFPHSPKNLFCSEICLQQSPCSSGQLNSQPSLRSWDPPWRWSQRGSPTVRGELPPCLPPFVSLSPLHTHKEAGGPAATLREPDLA